MTSTEAYVKKVIININKHVEGLVKEKPKRQTANRIVRFVRVNEYLERKNIGLGTALKKG